MILLPAFIYIYISFCPRKIEYFPSFLIRLFHLRFFLLPLLLIFISFVFLFGCLFYFIFDRYQSILKCLNSVSVFVVSFSFSFSIYINIEALHRNAERKTDRETEREKERERVGECDTYSNSTKRIQINTTRISRRHFSAQVTVQRSISNELAKEQLIITTELYWIHNRTNKQNRNN